MGISNDFVQKFTIIFLKVRFAFSNLCYRFIQNNVLRNVTKCESAQKAIPTIQEDSTKTSFQINRIFFLLKNILFGKK
jgi:hypothetical protein